MPRAAVTQLHTIRERILTTCASVSTTKRFCARIHSALACARSRRLLRPSLWRPVVCLRSPFFASDTPRRRSAQACVYRASDVASDVFVVMSGKMRLLRYSQLSPATARQSRSKRDASPLSFVRSRGSRLFAVASEPSAGTCDGDIDGDDDGDNERASPSFAALARISALVAAQRVRKRNAVAPMRLSSPSARSSRHSRGAEEGVSTLSAGAWFGEESLCAHATRAYTARAAERTTLL
eukprot:6204077-Pleurochrysis_carterae.AAC.1